MGRHIDTARRRLFRVDAGLLSAVVAVAAVLTGAQFASLWGTDAPAAASVDELRTPAQVVAPLQDPVSASTPAPGTTAVSVSLPSIGVVSALEALGTTAEGKVAAPVDFDLAGWFAEGILPGQVGPAIIAGHVDSTTGPAVFARLSELAPGDPVVVTLSDGSAVTFEVDGSLTAAKDAFPVDAVYGATPNPQLRLITCDGVFDRASGHYVDNLIVTATRVS